MFACRFSNPSSIPSWGGRVARSLLQSVILACWQNEIASLEANLGRGRSLLVNLILLFLSFFLGGVPT